MKALTTLIAAQALRDMLRDAGICEFDEITLTEQGDNEVLVSIPRHTAPVEVIVTPVGGYWRYPEDICFFVNWYGPDDINRGRSFQCNMGTDSIYRALIDIGYCCQFESDYQLSMREAA
jgi:hypothetical protein